MIPSARYVGRILLTSSRENPHVVWVRSLVPNEKNCASLAISSATSAARGNSIMVPTRYSTVRSFSANTSLATRCTIPAWFSNSLGGNQRNHDLGDHLHAVFRHRDCCLEDCPRLHFRDLGVSDPQAAATMPEHGIELVQLLHPRQQRRQNPLQIANRFGPVIVDRKS